MPRKKIELEEAKLNKTKIEKETEKKMISIKEIKPDIKEIKSEKEIEEQRKEEVEEEKDEKAEEEEEEFNEISWQQSRVADFPTNFPAEFSKAPVLEASEKETAESLEQELVNVPSRTSKEETKNITYVKNLPEYAASSYTTRAVYTTMEESGREIRPDIEMDITRTTFGRRTPTTDEIREINLRVWQREQLARSMIGEEGKEFREKSEREYQILQKKEKREKERLPFQE